MDRLGRYELKGLIGEGAMSEVYKAYDPVLQRTLAIKVLKPEFSEDRERLNFFLNEVKISGKLNHQNIVQIFDVGEVDDIPFIVMEFVECESLDRWIERQTEIDLDFVLSIVKQLGNALEYAHAKGIIHRDIKPSNILIESNGRVRLTDFGVAYLNEHDDCVEGKTIVGTPFYMSPEQLAGKVPDSRSDLYSLGIVFYQLVFGTLPFEASSIRDLMDLIQKSEVNLSVSQCPHAIKKVIRRLLHKKASFRYPNAGELIKQLEALPLELSGPGAKWGERVNAAWRYTAIVALSLSLLLCGFLIFTLNDLSKSLSGVLGNYGHMLVQQTQERVDEALLLGDALTLDVKVKAISDNDQVIYLHILNNERVVEASTDTAKKGLPYSSPVDLTRIENQGTTRIFQRDEDLNEGQQIYHLTAPIEFNGKEIGSVVLGLSAQSIEDVWFRTAASLLIFIIFACVMIPAVVYYICRFFIGQFSQIGQAVQSLYVGNYYARLNVERLDEIGHVKRQFNELAEQMEVFIQESDPDYEEQALPDAQIEETEDRTVVIRKTEDVV